MIQDFNSNSHRRYNILTGEWVLVSPHRTKRPWQGKKEKVNFQNGPTYDTTCYLCPENKHSNGDVNPKYDKPYSFVNDFSALLSDVSFKKFSKGLLKAESESGICKVICFSPDHSLTLPVMTVEAITDDISLWQKECKELGAIEGINHVQIFENKGDIMGCSNPHPHPHGQIWSQRSIPQEVKKKQLKFKEYLETNKRNLLEDYVSQELELNERVIIENEHFVALIPYWAVWPYEIIILPKKKIAHIGLLNDNQKVLFAEIIKAMTIRLDNIFSTSFPYSMGIYQAPTDGDNHSECIFICFFIHHC